MALHLRFTQDIGLARLQGVFRDVFGVAISQGGLVDIIRVAAAPFAAQAAQLRERLCKARCSPATRPGSGWRGRTPGSG